jgi:large subunit ribosomal protein L22
MEIIAKLNYLGITPRKVRLVADLLKGMEIKQAETQLKFIPKRAAVPLLKLLNSAVANAKQNFNLEKDSLYIKQVLVNEGPPFKRSRPVSRGRAFQIMKRTSHVNLVLGVKEEAETKKPAEKAKPIQAGPPKSEGFGGKPKFKAPRKIKKPGLKGLAKKIFRRKSF